MARDGPRSSYWPRRSNVLGSLRCDSRQAQLGAAEYQLDKVRAPRQRSSRYGSTAASAGDRIVFQAPVGMRLFAEGSRMQDLYRFGLVNARLGPGRATKLPLSRTEQLTNPHIGAGKETCPAVS